MESYGRRWWDWDLRDIRVDGKSLLQHIVDYVGKSHAGIIATHATLSDEILWLSCEERLRVGARGHVGYDLRDVDVVSEKTVAALLGMPELTLFEHLKDRIAETLCWSSEYGAKLVGSTPLHVPYVPWNGTLEPTPEAKELGWDLPQKIIVEVPSFAKRFGYRAYTEVGWQLALPKTLAYAAWSQASSIGKAFATGPGKKVATAINLVTPRWLDERKLVTYLDRSLQFLLKELYRAVSTAKIRGSAMRISMRIPALLATLNTSIDIGRDALANLSMKSPIRIIALSPDKLAGIIAYDKFWSPRGYRAVYFSFEIEACEGKNAEKLLINAIEWVKKWSYRETTELLGNIVRAPKEVATKFRETIAKLPGKVVLSSGILMNEEGGSEIELRLEPGTLHIVVAYPTTNEIVIDVAKGRARITNVTRLDTHVTLINVELEKSEIVALTLRAGSDTCLNPAYIVAKHEPHPVTPTQTTTTTETTAITTTITLYRTTTITKTIEKITTIIKPTITTITTTKPVPHTTTITITKPITIERTIISTSTISQAISRIDYVKSTIIGVVIGTAIGIVSYIAIRRKR